MKNRKGIVILISFVLLSLIIIGNRYVYALGEGFDANIFNNVTGNGTLDTNSTISKAGLKVYSTIATIIQVIAVGGVVFTGYKYMAASAQDKGNIKQTLIYVVIGTVLVFAATNIIKFILEASNSII